MQKKGKRRVLPTRLVSHEGDYKDSKLETFATKGKWQLCLVVDGTGGSQQGVWFGIWQQYTFNVAKDVAEASLIQLSG